LNFLYADMRAKPAGDGAEAPGRHSPAEFARTIENEINL